MQILRDLCNVPANAQKAVIALGNFDGLHLGHRAILHKTLEQAALLKAPAGVMIFEPHPREFFSPSAPKLRLMRLREKIDGLRAMGFSLLFMPHFNAALAATSAKDFVTKYLVEALAARYVFTGENFCFGSKRAGNSEFLAAAAMDYGFGYSAISPVMHRGNVISSTAIRHFLSEGNPQKAAELLGHPFTLCGHIMHGDKRGRMLGFPTANIPLNKYFVPRKGVYKIKAGKMTGVANIGIRPTFGGERAQAEMHFFDFSGDLYGQYMRVELHRFLRDEQAFSSLDALKQQIIHDCEKARNDSK